MEVVYNFSLFVNIFEANILNSSTTMHYMHFPFILSHRNPLKYQNTHQIEITPQNHHHNQSQSPPHQHLPTLHSHLQSVHSLTFQSALLD